MPLSAFLFVEARPVIAVTLGPKWEGVVPDFSILASVSFLNRTVTLWGMVAMSGGFGRRYFYLGNYQYIFPQWWASSLACPGTGWSGDFIMRLSLMLWRGPGLVFGVQGGFQFVLQISFQVWQCRFLLVLPPSLSVCSIQPLAVYKSALVEILMQGSLFGVVYLAVLGGVPAGRLTLKQVQNLFILARAGQE